MTFIVITGEIDLSVASMLGLSCAVMGALWDRGLTDRDDHPALHRCSARCSARSTASSSPGSGCPRWRSPSARWRSTAASRSWCSATARSPTSRSATPTWVTGTIGGASIPQRAGPARWCWPLIFGVVLHATPFGRSLFADRRQRGGRPVRRDPRRPHSSSGCSSSAARSPAWPACSGRCATPAPAPTTAPASSWPSSPPSCSAASSIFGGKGTPAPASLAGVLLLGRAAERAAPGRRLRPRR